MENVYPLEIYKSLFKWRWRVTADNGKIIGASSESFWNRKDCVSNAENLGNHLSANFAKDEK